MATLVLTVLGDDRPGLVSSLSAAVTAHGGSWERSELSRLAGKFAGIVVVSVGADGREPLEAAVRALDGLQVSVEPTDEPAPGELTRLTLDLLGDDRPGIVAEVSAALAAAHVSIEELRTGVREAPMAGGLLFEAHAVLTAPAGAGTETLRATLEAIADELVVEIDLQTSEP